jgi:hypothetical protein
MLGDEVRCERKLLSSIEIQLLFIEEKILKFQEGDGVAANSVQDEK